MKRYLVSLAASLVLLVMFLAVPKKSPAAEGSLDPALRPNLGKQATVVVFLSVGCPVSNAYLPHLNELAKSYVERGVKFVGVNSNDQDSADDVVKHAKEFSIAFPVLKDEAQKIADALGAERVPQVVLLDAKEKIHYRGRIDDRYAVAGRKDRPTRADLAIALDELLAGKAVSVAKTEVSGCLIGRATSSKTQPITYSKQVARIIQNKCQSCHRAEGVAPFALDDYDHVKGWAKMIKEVVVERRMPPWHADPHFGKFANDRSLSQTEIDTLVAWIDGGLVQGDDKDLPAPAYFPKGGWSIGEPDVVLQMPKEFVVPASGTLPYQEFIVETNFTEDRWIERAQVLPGSKTVHHAVVFTQGGGHGDSFCTYVPGDSPMILPPGTARRIPAGAKLKLNMHYTPTGKVERDRTSIGLVFAKEPPKFEVKIFSIRKKDLQIPPGAANHREETTATVPRDLQALSFFPHMHVRGKSWECRVTYPDGRTETFLKVPRYDFNWQHTYRFAEPLKLPAGTKVHCIAHYDNSKGNPANPDPTKTVKFGLQTWDEMMVAAMEYVVDVRSPTPAGPKVASAPEQLSPELVKRACLHLSGQAAKQSDLPLKVAVDLDKASGWRTGDRAAIFIPDQQLDAKLLDKVGPTMIPIGQLWLLNWSPSIEGKTVARDQMLLVKAPADGKTHELALCLLGVRLDDSGKPELALYGKDREPLLRVALVEMLTGQDSFEVSTKQDTTTATLTIRAAGRFQATVPVVEKPKGAG